MMIIMKGAIMRGLMKIIILGVKVVINLSKRLQSNSMIGENKN